MTVGERIKELRKKENMTQESLAEKLSISCQAVSKWECGVSNPDLSLIPHLTKLFNISADELLGINSCQNNDKIQKYNIAYKKYIDSRDYTSSYWLAKEAVIEFPNNYTYLEWLARAEYCLAFEENISSYSNIEYFEYLIDCSLRHYETIIDNCVEHDILTKAVLGKIIVLRFLDRIDEADWSAEFEYPDISISTANQALHLCNKGKELLKYLEFEKTLTSNTWEN